MDDETVDEVPLLNETRIIVVSPELKDSEPFVSNVKTTTKEDDECIIDSVTLQEAHGNDEVWGSLIQIDAQFQIAKACKKILNCGSTLKRVRKNWKSRKKPRHKCSDERERRKRYSSLGWKPDRRSTRPSRMTRLLKFKVRDGKNIKAKPPDQSTRRNFVVNGHSRERVKKFDQTHPWAPNIQQEDPWS